ncbi:MAG: DUF480 domain-containing protein, partial [Thermoleophilaceae bacterium]|nr:DUF480 domain-containing protein [Thermoleophilaceae bacterium]
SSRATKYRHLLEDKMGITSDDGAVLCVLLLRGDQTPGELKQRTERMHKFDDLDDLGDTLESLQRRELVKRLERRPGEKQVRYRHLLGAGDGAQDDSPALADDGHVQYAAAPAAHALTNAPVDDDLRSTVEQLKLEVAELRQQLAALIEQSPSDAPQVESEPAF